MYEPPVSLCFFFQIYFVNHVLNPTLGDKNDNFLYEIKYKNGGFGASVERFSLAVQF